MLLTKFSSWGGMGASLPLLSLLRPHQYIKNGFVLIGPLFSHQWHASMIFMAVITFTSFCCISSAVYILNDIMDIDADREHPVKRKRPLPSGEVSRYYAILLLSLMCIAAVFLAAIAGGWAVFFIGCYFFINIIYSWKWKYIVILDVFMISSGFMLRILSGTVALEIEPSRWLLLCGLMVTLLLGFSKRLAEIKTLQYSGASLGTTRRVLTDYSPIMLEQFIAVTSACTIISYALYTVSPATIELHGSYNLIYTLPFVTYGIFRYLYLLHAKSFGNDTAKDLLTDSHIIITIGAWVTLTVWILA